MKFSKFYFAALAAMTIASCSNEEDMVSQNSSELKLGEARVTYALRGNQTTYTRATDAEEKAIHSLVYAVYKNGETAGLPIDIKKEPVSGNSSIKFTIPQDVVTANNGEEMKILVVVNDTLQESTLNALTLGQAEALKSMKEIALEATDGLPASAQPTFNMQAGMVSISAGGVKRVVSRIYVKKNGTTGTIDGAQISFEGVASSANLFSTAVTTDATKNIAAVTVVGEDEQPVAYIYPTNAGATATVKLGASTKSVSLPLLEGNKQYALNITPSTTTNDGTGDWTVTFDEWEATTGGDVDVDMNVSAPTVIPNLSLQNGLVTSDDKNTLFVQGSSTGTISLTSSDIFGDQFQSISDIKRIEQKNAPSRAALPGGQQVGGLTVNPTDDGISIEAVNTKVGEDDVYEVTFRATDKNGSEGEYTLPLTVKGYPEGFSVIQNGIEIMTLGVKANDPYGLQVSALVKEINTRTGSDFADKVKSYVDENPSQQEIKVMGTGFTAAQVKTATCPAGFKIPTEEEMRLVFGDVTMTMVNGSKKDLPLDTPVQFGKNNTTTIVHKKDNTNKYFMVTDQDGHKMYVAGGDFNKADTKANNFANLSSATEAFQGVARVIFYGSEFQIRGASGLPDTWLRCIRKTN